MKPITKVFLIIATLVICLLVWTFVFSPDDGALKTGWNALATPVNRSWHQISGTTNDILPEFGVHSSLEESFDD